MARGVFKSRRGNIKKLAGILGGENGCAGASYMWLQKFIEYSISREQKI